MSYVLDAYEKSQDTDKSLPASRRLINVIQEQAGKLCLVVGAGSGDDEVSIACALVRMMAHQARARK